MNINFNGKIFPSDQPILSSNNRAFLYGDALFETLRMSEGNIRFLDFHIERLLKGLVYFKYKIPKKYTSNFFKKEIKKIAEGNARIRLTVFRSDGGLYTPKNNRPQFLITTSPLASPNFQLNKKGLSIGIFKDIKLPCTPISNLKTCNSLPYIQAGLYKKDNRLDDCLLLNEKGRVAEASSSNIFLLKKNKLITPSLSEGCIAGTMRKAIIQIAQQKGEILFQEKTLTLNALNQADEIWLTNAIQGIRWISQINSNQILPSPKIASTFIRKLNL